MMGNCVLWVGRLSLTTRRSRGQLASTLVPDNWDRDWHNHRLTEYTRNDQPLPPEVFLLYCRLGSQLRTLPSEHLNNFSQRPVLRQALPFSSRTFDA